MKIYIYILFFNLIISIEEKIIKSIVQFSTNQNKYFNHNLDHQIPDYNDNKNKYDNMILKQRDLQIFNFNKFLEQKIHEQSIKSIRSISIKQLEQNDQLILSAKDILDKLNGFNHYDQDNQLNKKLINKSSMRIFKNNFQKINNKNPIYGYSFIYGDCQNKYEFNEINNSNKWKEFNRLTNQDCIQGNFMNFLLKEQFGYSYKNLDGKDKCIDILYNGILNKNEIFLNIVKKNILENLSHSFKLNVIITNHLQVLTILKIFGLELKDKINDLLMDLSIELKIIKRKNNSTQAKLELSDNQTIISQKELEFADLIEKFNNIYTFKDKCKIYN